jgi:hypothetical protein
MPRATVFMNGESIGPPLRAQTQVLRRRRDRRSEIASWNYNNPTMLRRTIVALCLLASRTGLGAAPAPAGSYCARRRVPHPTAMFLASLSGDGRHQVTFKAAAMGTRFFFEEASGVTVYNFDGVGYRKLTFLKGFTLTKAIKKYAGT